MNLNSKIYVAGHRGMVGSAILRKLNELGFHNIITANSSELDLRGQAATREFFERHQPDYVFLAAAKVGGILSNNTYKAEFIYDNTAIALNVIDSAYRSGVKKLLNLGSSCIYPKFAEQPMREDALLTGVLEPTNEPYAIAKITAIKLCKYYNFQYGTDFISLMPTNLYGPNDNYNLEKSHVLPALMRKMILGKALMEGNIDLIKKDISTHQPGFGIETANLTESEIPETLEKCGIRSDSVYIWGSGKVLREFLHVDDLAGACIHFMKNIPASDMPDFVNIGSGEDLSIKDLAYLIKEITGYEGRLDFDTSKPDGTPRKLMDVSLAAKLGWKYEIKLTEGIKSVFFDYMKNY
jgi:GDP-L-fucose synthase